MTDDRLTMRRAQPADLDDVMQVIDARRQWLSDIGSKQWSTQPFRDRMERSIDSGFTWLLTDPSHGAVGTLTLTTVGDPTFWRTEELRQPALYVSKVATMPDAAGRSLGRIMIDWATRYGLDRDIPRLRWDSWRSNTQLHAYWASIGAKHVRTEAPEGWNTGALFERSFTNPPHNLDQQVTPPPPLAEVGVAPSTLVVNAAPTPYELEHGEPHVHHHHSIGGVGVVGDISGRATLWSDGRTWLLGQDAVVDWDMPELRVGHPYVVQHASRADSCFLAVYGDSDHREDDSRDNVIVDGNQVDMAPPPTIPRARQSATRMSLR